MKKKIKSLAIEASPLLSLSRHRSTVYFYSLRIHIRLGVEFRNACRTISNFVRSLLFCFFACSRPHPFVIIVVFPRSSHLSGILNFGFKSTPAARVSFIYLFLFCRSFFFSYFLFVIQRVVGRGRRVFGDSKWNFNLFRVSFFSYSHTYSTGLGGIYSVVKTDEILF